MAVSTQDIPPDPPRRESGPGRRLREARLARGLSLEEVAARLRLEVRTIERLEADAYAELPAPTFVRGYLKGYARVLDLAPEPIVAAYDSNEFSPPALVPDISSKAEARSTDIPVRLATYLVIGAVGVLLVLWWQSQISHPLDPPPEVTQELATEELIAEGLPAGETPGESGVESRVLPDVGEGDPLRSPQVGTDTFLPPPAEGRAIAGGSQTGASPEARGRDQRRALDLDAYAAELEPGTPVPAPQALGPAPQAGAPEVETRGASEAVVGALAGQPVPVPAPVPSGETASASAPPASPSGRAAVATAAEEDRLRIELEHESWVEVYGRDDERLYYALARPGETIDISGEAPFRIVLGYARDVQVEFNGEPIDYSAHLTRGMARFTLGESADDPEATPPRSDAVAATGRYLRAEEP